MSLQLQIIVGSTRPSRAADLVTPWVERTARAMTEFDVEVLDLRDWPLPIFQEHMGTIGDMADPTYSEPIVRRWNRKIREGEAYLVITPEYSHSLPAVLKNAIDSVFVVNGLRNKPMAGVSYSSGMAGGIRALEHLAQVAVEFEMVPLRAAVPIANVTTAFDEAGNPRDPMTQVALDITLQDLSWWGQMLQAARAAGELPTGRSRMMKARAALATK